MNRRTIPPSQGSALELRANHKEVVRSRQTTSKLQEIRADEGHNEHEKSDKNTFTDRH